MSYILAGSTIRRPNSMEEDNSTQYAANRILSGGNTRDYFGSNKRVWSFTYENLNVNDYNTINAIYKNYLANKTSVSFSSNEVNYPITANVHVDFLTRAFGVPGSSYLSNCTLVLTEA